MSLRRHAMILMMVVCLSSNAWASASFANRSLGLSASFMKWLGGDQIDFGVPLALEGAYYIENGFEAFLRVQFAILYQRAFVGPAGEGGVVFGLGGHVGARYLFLEESFRPYVQVQLALLGVFRADNVGQQMSPFQAGPGLGAGFDFFVNDSISVGLRATVDMLVTFRYPVSFVVGGGLNAATYF